MIQLLVLRPVDAHHKQELRAQGIELIERRAQDIVFLPQQSLDLSFLNAEEPLVFTSQHAVRAWQRICTQRGSPIHPPSCYAIKGQTTNAARSAGLHVLDCAHNAILLAKVIEKQDHKRVYHLCATDRLPILQEKLEHAKTEYVDVPVYEKCPLPLELPPHRGVVIFSPSQWTLYESATLSTAQEVFCIGDTTAATVEKSLSHEAKMMIASKPSKVSLFKLIQKYYTT